MQNNCENQQYPISRVGDPLYVKRQKSLIEAVEKVSIVIIFSLEHSKYKEIATHIARLEKVCCN